MRTLRTFLPFIAGILACSAAFADVEPNNSIAQAETVAFGANSGTVQLSLDDYDYYRTTSPDNGKITVSVTFAPGATGRIFFYNANGTSLGVSTTGNSVSRDHDCIGAGTVYYSVQIISGSGPVSYNANISLASPSYANDVEPNNSIGTTTAILSPNVEYDGRLGHVNSPEFPADNFDYYRAILPEDASTITVSGVSDNGMTFRFFVYNSNGTNLAVGIASSTPNPYRRMPGGWRHCLHLPAGNFRLWRL